MKIVWGFIVSSFILSVLFFACRVRIEESSSLAAAKPGVCKAANRFGQVTTLKRDSIDWCQTCSSLNSDCSSDWDNEQPTRNPVKTTYYIARDSEVVVTTTFKNGEMISELLTVRP